MGIEEKLALFFKDPTIEPSGTDQGVLYLLRREIQDCLIGKIVPENQVVAEAEKERHRLFLTVMALAAGVDLLAKFYAGSDDIGGVRERMKQFTIKYMFADKPDPALYADVLYFGCRNPMLHSFSMYNDRFKITLFSGKMQQGAIWRVPSDPKWFVIIVEGLYMVFIKAVQAYRAELETDSVLRTNFEKMFENYGTIPMFTAFVEPVTTAIV